MSGKHWTDAEEKTLGEVFPRNLYQDVLTALPGRTWRAIKFHAAEKKISRRRASENRPVHPLLQELRRIREAKNLRLIDVQELSGYHQNQIRNWETGVTNPDFRFVADIVESLGCQLLIETVERRTK